MANRRMFSLDVVDTDRFLDMSASAQALYFHLGMRADDDGFVSSPRKIAIEQRRDAAVLDILQHSRIGGVPYNTLQKIFKKYDFGSIGLCQVFAYGVIEGKRAERARRARNHD